MTHALVPEHETPLSHAVRPDRVSTAMHIPAAPERVWQGLLYYEQIEQRPPWLLRLLLPVPVRTLGSKRAVGDEALCEYERGYLKKRVTEIEQARCYRFAVTEQAVPVGGLRLLGGSYLFRACGDGGTELRLDTHYEGGRRPRWLFRPVEALVCHAFHRHILSAIARAALVD